MSPGDVAAQAERVMRNLERALHASECGLVDVLKTTVYVASSDRADLVAAWDVVRAAFGDHDPPSTLLGVAVLKRHEMVDLYPEKCFWLGGVFVAPEFRRQNLGSYRPWRSFRCRGGRGVRSDGGRRT